MGDIDGDDQAPRPSWLTCMHRSSETSTPCSGRQVDGFDHCLAHLEPDQLKQALQRLGPGADLEASGTDISAKLFEQILGAVSSENRSPTFGGVSFALAHFIEGVSFAGARFDGEASFAGARFDGDAVLDGAQFGSDAWFIDARFSGDASFAGARFSEGARFDGVRCRRDSGFNRAQFRGNASFVGAQFDRDARFDGAQFDGNARFDGAQFDGNARFDGAQFDGDARFIDARFEKATSLGPLAADNLIFSQAVFVRPVVIEAAAVRLVCNDATWEAGVTMRLRYAQVDLKHATFTESSFIAGIDQPFGLTPGFRRLDESKVLSRLRERRGVPERVSEDLWMPVVLSLRRADDFNLSFNDVDLSQHRRGIRFIRHLGWVALKAIGYALLWVVIETVEFLWSIVTDTLGKLAGSAALGFGGLLLKLLLGLSLVATFIAWVRTGNHSLYVAVIVMAAVAVAAVMFLARRWIADKWWIVDKLSLPIKFRYSHNSGWYASHAHTIVGACGTPWVAAHRLVTLRLRLRKADLPFKDHSLSHPMLAPAVNWVQVERCLKEWADFPVNSHCRPLVLLGPTVLTAPLPDGRARSAFTHGLIEGAPGFPAEILQALRHRQGTGTCSCLANQGIADADRVLTETLKHRYHIAAESEDATASLIDWHRQQGGPLGEPLLVTIAGRGSAQFLTDRGQRELPAWEVHAQGLRQPIWVLDPGTSERAWRPMGLAGHELAWHGSLAQLSKDGCTIALSFSVMADEHVIYPEAKVQFPGAKVLREEDMPVVAVVPVPVDTGRSDPPKRHEQRCEVSVSLTQPLRQRVLLDGNGCPVLVRDPQQRATVCLSGSKSRPAPVTWDEGRGMAVGHDDHSCPFACST